MGYVGYFTYGGSEFINVARTEAYANVERASWFRPIYKPTDLGLLLDETYVDAWNDDPPWGDPTDPDTYRFWGIYPLNITGLEDSSRTAEVTQNVNDGGYVSPMRHSAKSVVFECALVGETECAVEAGMNWLRSVLIAGPCDDSSGGADLCYLSCEPCVPATCVGDPQAIEDCYSNHERTLRGVTFTQGPTITSKRTTGDGGAVWIVSFTAVANNPFEYGATVELVEDFLGSGNPWVPSVIPADWAYAEAAEAVEDVDCSTTRYEPIVDPLCPAVVTPPLPPNIPLGCYDPVTSWDRRWFTLPRKYVPYWGDVVPTIRIEAGEDEVRQLRLRFYADVASTMTPSNDPCGFCGDILVSYIPASHTMVLDGVSETVYAEGPGGVSRRAESLTWRADGKPFQWPALTCGTGYVVTVDLPTGYSGTLPSIDLMLTPRSR